MKIINLFLPLLLIAATARAAPLVLYSPAVVDTLSGDTTQPALAHTLAVDTTTAADTAGWSIQAYMLIHRWPDSATVKLRGIGEMMLWDDLSEFVPDSVDGRRVWWSGSTMLEDSVIVPGAYEVSGDTLVIPGDS